MKKLTEIKVPLSTALVVLIAVALSAVFFAAQFRKQVVSYQLFLPGTVGEPQELVFGSWPALEDADFFNQVKQKFIKEKLDFIEADLSSMRLTVYLAGQVTSEIPILTKGREGSWWETPAGLYRIEGKEKNHFSGIAGVYLPWSMPFQGNFFIHGWPYYPDGTPVSSAYSGGCVRLSVEDAKKVFEAVKVGMPVLVFERDFKEDSFAYEMRRPQLSAEAYLAADLRSNSVLARRASDRLLPVASLSKLVAAMVAVEYVNIEKEIEITPEMIVSTSKPRLRPGQYLSLYQLLYPLLLESSNEAAVAISHFLGPKRFVELMNEKAEAIGMRKARFVDPAGVEAGNVATAEDLFAMAKYLYNNRSFILKLTSGKLDTKIYGPPRFSGLGNFNVFGLDPSFIGGKTGMVSTGTEAILSIFELPFRTTTRPVAIILLDSPDSAAEAKTLLSWIKSNYE